MLFLAVQFANVMNVIHDSKQVISFVVLCILQIPIDDVTLTVV